MPYTNISVKLIAKYNIHLLKLFNMNVKRFLRIAVVAAMITVTAPAIASPIEAVSEGTNGPGKEGQTAVQPLLQRLYEIKDMDKSHLTRSEKRDLRNEVKSIKKEMKARSQGVYLSVGAIIIIVLLLILLL
jgi:hypothetical protein